MLRSSIPFALCVIVAVAAFSAYAEQSVSSTPPAATGSQPAQVTQPSNGCCCPSSGYGSAPYTTYYSTTAESAAPIQYAAPTPRYYGSGYSSGQWYPFYGYRHPNY